MTEACFPGPLCSVGAEVLGPAHMHVRVLLLYSQLLLLPHSNSSNTSRGRPGARHPPLRGDSATPGRLPAGLRRRLDHDTQARCSRPARAFCPGLLPSRSLPARLQRLAPAARQKKKSGSTPWVVGACVTRGGHRMSAWSRCQRCHELLARTTVREAAQALLRRRCIRPGPFHQVQGHRLGRRLVSTTAEDIEAVSLEAKILRARSRPRLQPTYRISALKTPVRSRAGGSEVKSVPYGALGHARTKG